MADVSFTRDEIELYCEQAELVFGAVRGAVADLSEAVVRGPRGPRDGRDDHAFPVDREDVDYIEELCLLVLRAVAVRRAETEDEARRAIARAVESRESRGAFL